MTAQQARRIQITVERLFILAVAFGFGGVAFLLSATPFGFALALILFTAGTALTVTAFAILAVRDARIGR